MCISKYYLYMCISLYSNKGLVDCNFQIKGCNLCNLTLPHFRFGAIRTKACILDLLTQIISKNKTSLHILLTNRSGIKNSLFLFILYLPTKLLFFIINLKPL